MESKTKDYSQITYSLFSKSFFIAKIKHNINISISYMLLSHLSFTEYIKILTNVFAFTLLNHNIYISSCHIIKLNGRDMHGRRKSN